MKSRWTDQGAREAIQRWGGEHGEAFALRVYSARLIGGEADLVLHGGGNVSFKGPQRTLLGDEVEAIYVKGSGRDLASIDPADLPGLDLGYLRCLRSLDALTDEEMVNALRTHLFNASAPTPSIETLLHAFVPHTFVDHSHADSVLVLTNQPNGEQLIREALDDKVAIVPYFRPGFELAGAVAQAVEANPEAVGVVLLHHGLITFGDDARTTYERHIALVDVCERFIERRARGASLTTGFSAEAKPMELATRVAPLLRGVLAAPTGSEDQPYLRSILEWRATDEILGFVNSREARKLGCAGALTGDHLIHTGAHPMFVDDPPWSDDDDALQLRLRESVEVYREEYSSYVAGRGESLDEVDPLPRVALIPGAGLFCRARTKRQAGIVADIIEHTLRAKVKAHLVGEYVPLSQAHLCDMEYRTLQRAKLGTVERRPLEGQVVVISGGGGAIGAAVAEVCARAGAHLAVTDVDEERLRRVVGRVEDQSGVGSALGVAMDVTSETSVREGFAEILRHFGGVDVIVPNAGIAHVAPIDELKLEDFRRVMEINAVGYLLFMKEGIKILKRQGLGGHIVINASKNVFGPGKDFAAYSASKAAGHQLGKVAAIELAPHGIRVNMINADAVFGNAENPSGLWATVGPGRAKSRDMTLEELPEYYRSRNLLKARVEGHHVGNAVVFFASNATPTTGATLPVDGGVVEAFPR